MTHVELILLETEGVTEFQNGKLPETFREYFLYHARARNFAPMDDQALVDMFIRGPWLGQWGFAKIDGDEVAVFEMLYEDPAAQTKVTRFSIAADCSLILVGPCFDFWANRASA